MAFCKLEIFWVITSAAKPKIADYPFTTLIPNLGIVRYSEDKSFVVADMPGLIEGAHTGKGLGIEFLRHIERTRVIVFMIECITEDPETQYKTLVNELKSFNETMLKKPQIIAITKMDLADDTLRKSIKKIKFPKKAVLFESQEAEYPLRFSCALLNNNLLKLTCEELLS